MTYYYISSVTFLSLFFAGILIAISHKFASKLIDNGMHEGLAGIVGILFFFGLLYGFGESDIINSIIHDVSVAFKVLMVGE